MFLDLALTAACEATNAAKRFFLIGPKATSEQGLAGLCANYMSIKIHKNTTLHTLYDPIYHSEILRTPTQEWKSGPRRHVDVLNEFSIPQRYLLAHPSFRASIARLTSCQRKGDLTLATLDHRVDATDGVGCRGVLHMGGHLDLILIWMSLVFIGVIGSS